MTVIYLFVSPSGRAYTGRHTCDHEGWPRRGSGALPSGYRGSGKLWANVTRRHGSAIRWIILRRFGPDATRADIDAAERRAVRLARRLWADRCVNLLEGGEGLTSADARALWADPEIAARQRAAVRQAQTRPEVKARHRAGVKASWADPEVKARRVASNKDVAGRPEVRAKISATLKEVKNTPEARDHMRGIQSAIIKTPNGAAALARAWAAANTPDAIAKCRATRLRNKLLREGQSA